MAGMVLIARFHAAPDKREALRAALAALAPPTRAEPGCLSFEVLNSNRDPDLFFIHSRWQDEAAFDRHAELAHTQRFVTAASAAIDHAFDAQRLFIEI
jgi:quinol monooxygenase YgiN